MADTPRPNPTRPQAPPPGQIHPILGRPVREGPVGYRLEVIVENELGQRRTDRFASDTVESIQFAIAHHVDPRDEHRALTGEEITGLQITTIAIVETVKGRSAPRVQAVPGDALASALDAANAVRPIGPRR